MFRSSIRHSDFNSTSMVPVIDEVGSVVAMCVIGPGCVGGCIGCVNCHVGHADWDADINNGRVGCFDGRVGCVDGRVGRDLDLDGDTDNGHVGCMQRIEFFFDTCDPLRKKDFLKPCSMGTNMSLWKAYHALSILQI